jgi:predicted dinucleotide-binding enzyme
MRFGVLGTGMVGTTIATRLVELGHEVKLGSRSAGGDKAREWVSRTGASASEGSFADAAKFGEIVFNCTSGDGALEALGMAGEGNLAGKVLVDISNPLDFSKGMPPTLSIFNDDSLGERIQRTFPQSKVVKTLNTVNAKLMVDPSRLQGEHTMFVSGNDAGAKAKVKEILGQFGWKDLVDLGDISMARGTESYLPLWLRLYGALGTADFNIRIVR